MSGNWTPLNKIEKQKSGAENDFKKTDKGVRRYFDVCYKAKFWKYGQRVVVKIEVNAQGTNIHSVVTPTVITGPKLSISVAAGVD